MSEDNSMEYTRFSLVGGETEFEIVGRLTPKEMTARILEKMPYLKTRSNFPAGFRINYCYVTESETEKCPLEL